MKKWCLVFTLFFLLQYASGQKKILHRAYPGIRFDVLESWFINNPHDPNQTGLLKQISLTGTVDIWKESSLTCGIFYGQVRSDEFKGQLKLYQFPLILRKYFNPERKGINVATSIQPGWILDEGHVFILFFGNEIGYQLKFKDLSMNTGLTVQFNSADNGSPISHYLHLGIFVQGMIFR